LAATVSRDVHDSQAAHWCSRCHHTLLLSAVHHRAHTQHGRDHLPHLKQRAHSATTFTAALSNVYDARRPTYDGAGAGVTRIIHAVRALARWESPLIVVVRMKGTAHAPAAVLR
jgi:hypothetical protein